MVITFLVATSILSTLSFFWNSPIISWCDIFVISLCQVISTFSFMKIFFTLRHYQHKVQDHVQQPNQTTTLLWLQNGASRLLFTICNIAKFVLPCRAIFNRFQLYHHLSCLNSSLNPILYCWKMDEVKQAVKDTIRQMLCC